MKRKRQPERAASEKSRREREKKRCLFPSLRAGVRKKFCELFTSQREQRFGRGEELRSLVRNKQAEKAHKKVKIVTAQK